MTIRYLIICCSVNQKHLYILLFDRTLYLTYIHAPCGFDIGSISQMKGIEMKTSSSLQIDRRRVTDQIMDSLVRMIANGKLKPGDKLPAEHELMKQFGVGRSSLREAIGALSLLGLLTVQPGHGTHVNASSDRFLAKPFKWGMLTMGRDKLHELIEARIVIETAIVGMAAERATEEDLAEIRRHHARMASAKKGGKRTIQADLGFHSALAKASHNSVLMRFLSGLRQPMRNWMEQKASFNWGYDEVIEQHDAIVKAIEAHDIEKAQSALRKHLESVGERLTTALLERRLT